MGIEGQIQLEQAVMDRLLAGSHPTLARLREQFALSSVRGREFTGCGFFTSFRVSGSVLLLENRSFRIGDVEARLRGMQSTVGFVQFISGGHLDMLEGYTYNEPWPDEVVVEEIWYHGGQARDVASLNRMLDVNTPGDRG
ncbi:hypothetical protein KQI84_08120 [bacterium]|nr:hypothetical protein [bacterium]